MRIEWQFVDIEHGSTCCKFKRFTTYLICTLVTSPRAELTFQDVLFVQDTSLDTVQFALRHFRVVEQAVPKKPLFGVEVFYQEQETRLRPENCTILFPGAE